MKKVDSQGRIAIPIKWRRKWKSSKVMLIRRGNRVEVVPIESTSPSSLFDSIEIANDVDSTDVYSLKKALLR